MKLHLARSGQGKPLILLHGLFGSSSNWAPIVRILQARLDVISPDLRNHGRSPHSGEAGLEAMAGDVLELMDSLGLQSCRILGHSLGGRVAMRLALDFPRRVERLLVADMAPSAQGPLVAFQALGKLDTHSLTTRAEADERLKAWIQDPAMRAFLLTNLARDESGTFGWRMNLAGLNAAQEGLRAAMASARPFEGPTLFLKSENSGLVTEGDEGLIRELFPNAAIRSLAGTGHWLHADKPAEFAAEALAFFS
jgi:esterase